MANDRLFIYDTKNKVAICIAKGEIDNWRSNYGETLNKFFDDNIEYNILGNTKFELKTEGNLPSNTPVYWSDGIRNF